MDSNQEAFIHDNPGNVQSFLDAVKTIKPTAIIGKFNVEVHVSIWAGKTLIYCMYVSICYDYVRWWHTMPPSWLSCSRNNRQIVFPSCRCGWRWPSFHPRCHQIHGQPEWTANYLCSEQPNQQSRVHSRGRLCPHWCTHLFSCLFHLSSC